MEVCYDDHERLPMDPLIQSINRLLTGNVGLVTNGYFLWPIPGRLSPGMVARIIDIYTKKGWVVEIVGGSFLKFTI